MASLLIVISAQAHDNPAPKPDINSLSFFGSIFEK
jgi:hypothetical protein